MFVYFGLNIFPCASGVCDSFQPQYHGVASHGSPSAEAGWHSFPFIELWESYGDKVGRSPKPVYCKTTLQKTINGRNMTVCLSTTSHSKVSPKVQRRRLNFEMSCDVPGGRGRRGQANP